MKVKTIAESNIGLRAAEAQDEELNYTDYPAPSVMVSSESDLADLAAYPAGTIAYTAGFKAMWQLDQAGNWVNMMD